MTVLAHFDYPNKHVLAESISNFLRLQRQAGRDFFLMMNMTLGHLSRLGSHRVDDKATVILHC